MVDEAYQKNMYQVLSTVDALLNARLQIINATGTQGIADEVRALTGRLHQYAIGVLSQGLKEWGMLSFNEQSALLDHAFFYIKAIYVTESATEHKLQQLIAMSPAAEVPAILKRALKIHSNLLASTEEVMRSIEELKNSASYQTRHQYLPPQEQLTLLNATLFGKRQELTRKLPKPNTYKAKL